MNGFSARPGGWRQRAGVGVALLLGGISTGAQTRQAILGGAFHGVAFGDSVEAVTALVREHSRDLRSITLEAPFLPVTRERETHLIAVQFQTDDGAAVAELAFSFADDALTLIEARGGALDALVPRSEGQPMSFLGRDVFPATRLVAEVEQDAVWVLSPEAFEAYLFLWANPHLPSVGAAPVLTRSAAKPDFLVFGQSLEEFLAHLERSGVCMRREEIAEPWLPTRPEVQTQVDCFGPAYAGFPRKIEAVFGDGRLQLAWILMAAGEEERLRAALVEAFGPPEFVSQDWEAFDGWRVALRKDQPEVLMVASELAPFHQELYGAGAPVPEAQAEPAVRAGTTLIRDVTVISPERAVPLEHASVLLRAGRIAGIGLELAAPQGARVVEASGRFLIPGLLDSHVHIGHPILLDDATIEARPELLQVYRTQLPRSFLHSGFTTLIDLDLRPEDATWFLSTPVHPRLFHAGRGIRIAGGYGPSLFPESVAYQVFPSLVFEPEQAGRWPAELDPEAYTPARAVRRVKDTGAICLKTYVEPGFGGVFDWPIPSLQTLRALGHEASANELRFVVHATDTVGWRRALEAGADVLAHGLWHWPGDRRDPEPSAEALALFAEAGRRRIAVQPTLRVLFGEQETFTWERLDDPRLARVLAPELLAWARTEPGRSSQRELRALGERLELATGVPAGELLESMNRRVLRALQCMRASGVRLVLGSDTPATGGLGNPPGLNGLLELELWAAAGVPLSEILEAATLTNARAFGLESELGSIEAGKRADLLLLRANPLVDVGAYDAIEAVVVGGDWIPRESLSALR